MWGISCLLQTCHFLSPVLRDRATVAFPESIEQAQASNSLNFRKASSYDSYSTGYVSSLTIRRGICARRSCRVDNLGLARAAGNAVIQGRGRARYATGKGSGGARLTTPWRVQRDAHKPAAPRSSGRNFAGQQQTPGKKTQRPPACYMGRHPLVRHTRCGRELVHCCCELAS
jgi:hypothetical protein